MLSIRTILHPTDLSPNSDYALWVAASLARGQGARLVVLHVLHAAEPPAWIYDRMAREFPWTEDGNRVLEQRLRPVRQSSPGLVVECRVVEGSPSEEILRLADAEPCHLIVMGTHGRTGLDRVLMGSVAERVVRKARCPVLTVKDPSRDASPASRPKVSESAAALGASE